MHAAQHVNQKGEFWLKAIKIVQAVINCNSAARYDIVTAYYAVVRSYYDLAGTQRIAGPLLRHF